MPPAQAAALCILAPANLVSEAHPRCDHSSPRQCSPFYPRRCYRDGQFEQAVGIAQEARRLDHLEAATQRSPAPVKTLTYALRVSQRLVISRHFREQVCAWRASGTQDNAPGPVPPYVVSAPSKQRISCPQRSMIRTV